MVAKLLLLLGGIFSIVVRCETWQSCMLTDYHAVISAEKVSSMCMDVVLGEASDDEELYLIGANVV